MIQRLFEAGADVFRINMSHSSHEVLNNLVSDIRAVEKIVRRPIGILADLQGPKLRLGLFAEKSISVEKGDRLTLDGDPAPGDKSRVQLPHPEVLAALKPDQRILVDDGRVQLKVIEASDGKVLVEVVVGTTLSNRKGMSFPDTVIPTTAMTEKDRADADAAIEAGADWIALSFIQRPADVAELRKIVRGRAGIMSKIEKPQALEHLHEIVELSDGLMVARGDLGVEMPLEQVPGIQKRITRLSRRYGKPVIVATQMLESMIESPVPTRAEVSDVATAVFEGADAVMLSAESAAGRYPVEAVSTMNRIAEAVETDDLYPPIIHAQRSVAEATGQDAISLAARTMTDTLDLAAIVCWTFSGATAIRASRERPRNAIVVLTPNINTARRMALPWGLHSVLTDDVRDMDDMVRRACDLTHQEGFAKIGERVVIIAGLPFGTPGSTNMMRIAFINVPH
ncbi:pyruvate kinase [Agaricicola taiwanensis]|uniref:Pyruvate kinase n=2 Tax=Agaricicola taiwanensis TaxID=591372 RepID=A0A8J2VUK3_9RHOB|nr:pyruvate kinase [Agaricicola taiwanensis]